MGGGGREKGGLLAIIGMLRVLKVVGVLVLAMLQVQGVLAVWRMLGAHKGARGARDVEGVQDVFGSTEQRVLGVLAVQHALGVHGMQQVLGHWQMTSSATKGGGPEVSEHGGWVLGARCNAECLLKVLRVPAIPGV